MWRRRPLPGEFVPVSIVPRTSSRTPSTESTGLVSWPGSGACCSVVLVSLEDVQGEPTVMMPRGCTRLLRLRRMVNPELHRCRSVLLPGRRRQPLRTLVVRRLPHRRVLVLRLQRAMQLQSRPRVLMALCRSHELPGQQTAVTCRVCGTPAARKKKRTRLIGLLV